MGLMERIKAARKVVLRCVFCGKENCERVSTFGTIVFQEEK